MGKYVINKDFSGQREVEAAGFKTVGDFIDFYTVDEDGDIVVTLRIRSARVETIDLVSG
ncbi:hypothetical protein GCM10018793_03030 [Streptomyces sulfonofaciens]|uniref:Uncharacterized protein n=1 Tax=Streptomyces sulfonofaciens TaxID=68272 RepID=A0A919KRY7_9ACTN|nr:hypothetical protein [Streptomyces sulfonofaciens]GHH69881.1 hypothetical protein GCM10018793_03030 [Streptomyces sulfonofaciens]